MIPQHIEETDRTNGTIMYACTIIALNVRSAGADTRVNDPDKQTHDEGE